MVCLGGMTQHLSSYKKQHGAAVAGGPLISGLAIRSPAPPVHMLKWARRRTLISLLMNAGLTDKPAPCMAAQSHRCVCV